MDEDRNSSRQRQVSFSIGDSTSASDSETVTSGSQSQSQPHSARTSRSNGLDQEDPSKENEGEECEGVQEVEVENNGDSDSKTLSEDKWRKYHFHDEIVGYVSPQMEVKLESESESVATEEEILEETTPSISETTRMIPSSEADYTLAKLADVDIDIDGSHPRSENHLTDSSRWRILVGCGIVQFFSALNVSLQAPFYPAEAEKKGASATEYCFVFGVYELIVFVSLPLLASKMRGWRPKLVFNLGIFTTAIASITFGMLDKVNGRQYFIASCAMARCLEGLGESALVTASLIIVSSAFPESIASTIAILETFYGLGLILGPIVGSFLYQIGGFSLPFLVVGGALLLSAFLNFLVLPSSKAISTFQERESVVVSTFKTFKLLYSSSGGGGFALAMMISAFSILIGAMSISYLQATLEPHLRQFNISQLSIGAIFIINGGVHAFSSPFLGLLCEKVLQLKLVTFCGGVLLITGFALIGPLPVFPFQPKLWIICMGLSLQGLGLGAIFVSSLMSIHRDFRLKAKVPDTPSTYASVSCLITCLLSLGSFIGAGLSGVLYDAVGFPLGTTSIIGLTSLVILITLLYICISDSEITSFIEETEDESEITLLNNSTTAAEPSFYSDDAEPSTSQMAISRWNNRKNDYGSMRT